MGGPIKLLGITKKLIQILERDSEILIVGLRQGEKIKEELWSIQENIFNTERNGIKALNLDINKKMPTDYLENPLSDHEAIAEINRFIKDSKVGM
jgi:FlaA1/EpsC-like NDP-sugar epimerase